MCGIIGVFGKRVTEKVLKEFLVPIKHRGYKHFETAIFKEGGLGTNRLPIVSERDGKQPVTNEEGNIFAVLNGEIYNHDTLRKELVKRGHEIESKCDTALIPHLYEEYGAHFIEKIDSEMFAIILYDKQKNRWLVARDRLGVKPLYRAEKDGVHYFASEIKQLSSLQARLEEVKPGTHIENGMEQTYYTVSHKIVGHRSKKETLERLRRLFDQAVKKRIPKDLPIGILLSGGVDSSALLATALKYTQQVTAFIAGTPKAEDRRMAVAYCERQGIPYKIIEPKHLMISEVRELVKIVESKTVNTITQATVSLQLCQEIARHKIKVVLCGEGADELFAGYNEFIGFSESQVETGISLLLKHLHKTQLQRVDRTAMAHTIEVRAPYLDTALVDFAMSIPGRMKIKKGVTKMILRMAMLDRLPSEIVWREKMPLATGAGLAVGDAEDHRISYFVSLAAQQFQTERSMIRTFYTEAGYDSFAGEHAVNKNNLVFATRAAMRINEGVEKMQRTALIRKQETENVESEILRKILNGEKIHLLLLWGAGEKMRVDKRDRAFTTKIREIKEGFDRLSPGVRSTIILSDKHAISNQHNPVSVYLYLMEMKRMLRREGHSTLYLGALYGEGKLGSSTKWDNLSPACQMALLKGAEKMYNGPVEEGAKAYASMRLAERGLIEERYSDAILLVPGREEQDEILPRLPKLYLTSFETPPWLD